MILSRTAVQKDQRNVLSDTDFRECRISKKQAIGSQELSIIYMDFRGRQQVFNRPFDCGHLV